MGWGSLIKEVVLYRVYPKDIQSRLDEADEMIHRYNEELIALAASPPREVRSEDDSYNIMWDEYVTMRVREIMEARDEEMRVKNLCEVALVDPDNVEEY